LLSIYAEGLLVKISVNGAFVCRRQVCPVNDSPFYHESNKRTNKHKGKTLLSIYFDGIKLFTLT